MNALLGVRWQVPLLEFSASEKGLTRKLRRPMSTCGAPISLLRLMNSLKQQIYLSHLLFHILGLE